MNSPRLALSTLSLALMAALPAAQAGVFLQFNGRPASQVVHPRGYNGTGGLRSISVCLDPGAPPPSGGLGQAEQAVRNVVAEYNRFQGDVGNVTQNPTPGADFEGVLLHEVGHCIGMGHTSIGPSETAQFGATSASRYFTNAMPGPNAVLNTGVGADNARGSRDDARSDDINLHWFQRNVNNPWAAPPGVVDRTTYTVDTSQLPSGYAFAEIASAFSPCETAANTSVRYSQAPTQNTMFPVICSNNLLRDLSPDDVSLLRIARAGKDGSQGTADDYTTQLNYIGQTNSCDVVIKFVSGAGFAFCSVGGTTAGVSPDITITAAEIRFESTVAWRYNQTDTTGTGNTPAEEADLAISKSSPTSNAEPGEQVVYTVTVTNSGPSAASAVMVTDPLPAGLTWESNTGDCITAYPCSLGSLANAASATITSTYRVNDNVANATTITNTATVSSLTPDDNAANNSGAHAIAIMAASSADLVLTKQASTNAAEPGGPVTFSFRVRNDGPASTDVTINDWEAPGLDFVSATGACIGGFPCNLGTLASGASSPQITVTYTVDQAASEGEVITHTTSAGGSTPDPIGTNNSAVDMIMVSANAADLIFCSGFEDSPCN